ncbi:DUF4019 domain-containing protein [Massilia aurea]|uniref:DUF4019 domain-containing protein n=1 Tax=Massilia aurea TaxID=373040 RepID=UPI0034631495
MSRLAPIAIAALFSLPILTVQAQQADQTKPGIEAAERWLALADAGKGADTWTTAGTLFQGAVSQKEWSAALGQARAPLGALTKRTLADARATRTLPGAPEADYVVLQYESSFANRPLATETVVVVREADGSWKTITYLIR